MYFLRTCRENLSFVNICRE